MYIHQNLDEVETLKGCIISKIGFFQSRLLQDRESSIQTKDHSKSPISK